MKKLLLLLLLFPASVWAQNSISGKVVSLVDKKPIPNVSIFLSNTSTGTKSLPTGAFSLNNIKNGEYDLVVSCVGYETWHQNVMLNNKVISIPEIALMPKITELKEVKIKYRDATRDKYLAIFKAEFLGHSAKAKLCKLVNPEVIDFDYDKATDKLSASTHDFLIVENRALGYRIKYIVKSFLRERKSDHVFYSGSSVFELLDGSAEQQVIWQNNREEAYLGSDMHFLRSALNGSLKDDGFKAVALIIRPNPERPADSLIKARLNYYGRTQTGLIERDDTIRYYLAKERLPLLVQYLVDTALTTKQLIHYTDLTGIYVLKYPEALHITYHKRNSYNSNIIFNSKKDYAIFDENGVIHNPDSNIMQGHWAYQRVADLLPVDYEVPGPKPDTGPAGNYKKNPTKF